MVVKIEFVGINQEKLLKITELLRDDSKAWVGESLVKLEKITPKLNEGNTDVSFNLILTIIDDVTQSPAQIRKRKIIELIFNIVEPLPEE